MLSKEEIENGKAHLKWMLDNGILTSEDDSHVETVLEYIEQLEQEKNDRICADKYENSIINKLQTREQKLIEKLEECAVSYYTLNEYEEYVRNRDIEEFAQEILEILKGETNERKGRE